jgi:tetrahydromethanopterin S-methyltransferase subunit G
MSELEELKARITELERRVDFAQAMGAIGSLGRD